MKYWSIVCIVCITMAGALGAFQGDDCSDPFVIPSLPFWQETTTVNFSADYSLPDGNSCTGHTTLGKDVVYSYTVPDTLDTVCITLSVIIPQDFWNAAIYILTDCDNLVCVAGADDYGPGSPEALTFSLAPGETYYFVVDGRGENDEGPFKFSISDCYTGFEEKSDPRVPWATNLNVRPSIASSDVVISFTLSKRCPVDITVMDVQGRVLKKLLSTTLEAGLKRVSWNGRDEWGRLLPEGTYIVRLVAGERSAVARIMLVR